MKKLPLIALSCAAIGLLGTSAGAYAFDLNLEKGNTIANDAITAKVVYNDGKTESVKTFGPHDFDLGVKYIKIKCKGAGCRLQPSQDCALTQGRDNRGFNVFRRKPESNWFGMHRRADNALYIYTKQVKQLHVQVKANFLHVQTKANAPGVINLSYCGVKKPTSR